MEDEVKKAKSIPKDPMAFATGALENPTENVNMSFPSALEFVNDKINISKHYIKFPKHLFEKYKPTKTK